MSWIDQMIKGDTKEERLKDFLAFCLGTFCPSEEGLNNMVDGILYILGIKTLDELKEERKKALEALKS